jgi:hypothetical protein
LSERSGSSTPLRKCANLLSLFLEEEEEEEEEEEIIFRKKS